VTASDILIFILMFVEVTVLSSLPYNGLSNYQMCVVIWYSHPYVSCKVLACVFGSFVPFFGLAAILCLIETVIKQ